MGFNVDSMVIEWDLMGYMMIMMVYPPVNSQLDSEISIFLVESNLASPYLWDVIQDI